MGCGEESGEEEGFHGGVEKREVRWKERGVGIGKSVNLELKRA